MGLNVIGASVFVFISGYMSTSHFDIEGEGDQRSSSTLTLHGLGEELERARSEVLEVFPPSLRHKVASLRCQVIIASTTQEFVRRSGVGPYHAAGSRGQMLFFQPFSLLARYPDLASVIRHEYTHVVLERFYGQRLSRWLSEGLAMHISGERPPPPVNTPPTEKNLHLAEKILSEGRNPEKMKWAYRLAFDSVRARTKNKGIQVFLTELTRKGID